MATQPSLLSTIWSLWGLAFMATATRIIVRLRIRRQFQAEDGFAVLAFVFLTCLTSVVTGIAPLFGTEQEYLEALAGNAKAVPPYPYDVMQDRMILALKLMFSHMLLFWSTIWASKCSLLVFLRPLVSVAPRYIMVWWSVVALVLFSYLGCMLSNFLTCVPLAKYWSNTGCSDANNISRSDVSIRVTTALDIFSDLLIMLLPLRLIWTLRISATQKLALGGLFSLGMIVVIFAFVRLFNFTTSTSEGVVDTTKLADAPLTLSLWSQIEAALSVIVANLPALRSFLRRQLGGPPYESKELDYSGRSGDTPRKKLHKVRYPGTMDASNESKSAFRLQSVELASLDGNEEEWPITGKAAAMLGIVDRSAAMKSVEAGEAGILAVTEVRVTRSARTDEHVQANSGGDTFGLQLRPDLA